MNTTTTLTPHDRAVGITARWLTWLADHRQPAPPEALALRTMREVRQIILEAPERSDNSIEIALRIMAGRAHKHHRPLSDADLDGLSALVSAYRDAGPEDLRWLYSALDLIAQIEKQGAL